MKNDIKKAIFLDRDGTINIDKGYIEHFIDIELFPDTIPALQQLGRLGEIVIITNQSGIARGYYSEVELNQLHTGMIAMLKDYNIKISGIYHCPHHPKAGLNPVICKCRKPKPGMLLKAAKELNLDLQRSYMVGDKVSDIMAGKNAGTKSLFINSGKEDCNIDLPDFIAQNLAEAACWIEKDIAGSEKP